MARQLNERPSAPLRGVDGRTSRRSHSQETEATCDDCAMCAKGDNRPSALTFFDPDVKCCSYVPKLPNFLVGRILADGGPSLAVGKETVKKRMEAGIAVTPLGLGQSPAYSLLYRHSMEAFGRSHALRCPHYVEEGSGLCGIWRHRNSVCATYFCKFVRGAVGRQFWRTLHQLLVAMEDSLARWCVLQLDVDSAALQHLFAPSRGVGETDLLDGNALDGVVDAAKYRALWGNWLNREEEFYQECAQLVNALSWQEVTAVRGPEVHIIARPTRETYGRLMADGSRSNSRLARLICQGLGLIDKIRSADSPSQGNEPFSAFVADRCKSRRPLKAATPNLTPNGAVHIPRVRSFTSKNLSRTIYFRSE